jgi:Fe-S-cluster-containing hydrogenase component 2
VNQHDGRCRTEEAQNGVPNFDREKCVHCGACLWNCASATLARNSKRWYSQNAPDRKEEGLHLCWHTATMEADVMKTYSQDDATGFIRLSALRLKVAAKVQRKK